MFYGGDISMKRDLDLIRLIHLKVEDDYDCAELINLKIDGYSANSRSKLVTLVTAASNTRITAFGLSALAR